MQDWDGQCQPGNVYGRCYRSRQVINGIVGGAVLFSMVIIFIVSAQICSFARSPFATRCRYVGECRIDYLGNPAKQRALYPLQYKDEI